MKSLIAKVSGIVGILLMCLIVGHPVEAAEAYTYDGASNTYTIQKTSGNITTTINDIIDTMTTKASNPGTIVIEPGIYDVNLINLKKSYVTIKAEGATLKFAGSQSNGNYLIKCTNSSIKNVRIEGGIWDGNKRASNVFSFASLSTSADGIEISNCTVKNAKAANIYIKNGKNIKITNVETLNTGYGIYLGRTTNIVLDKVKAQSCKVGLDMRKLNGTNELKDVIVQMCTTVGIQIKDQPTVVTMTGGNCTGNYAGISLTTGAKLTMNNVEVDNNKSNGISPVGQKARKTILNIYNCTFNNNGRHGVAAANYVQVYAKDCTMNGNTSNGIMMRDYCSSSGLINLTTNGNTLNGILIQGNSTCKEISGCVSNGNKANGLMLVDVSTLVEDVTATKNSMSGMWSSSSKSKTITVRASEFTSNGKDGLYVSDKAAYDITNTAVKNNKAIGVDCNGGTAKLTGTGNQVTGNKKYGACVTSPEGVSGALYISGATIANNTKVGVFYYGNVKGYCVNAKITAGEMGIWMAEGAAVSKLIGNTITNATKSGVYIVNNNGTKNTSVSQFKYNILSNPKADHEILVGNRVTVPAKLRNGLGVTIDSTVKAGKTQVTGTATKGCKVTIKIGKKTYTIRKVGTTGSYSQKVSKLQKGETVVVTVINGDGNKIITQKKL